MSIRPSGKFLDYFLAAVLMSLAWSARGQFGHLKGALIPGVLAGIIVYLLRTDENRRQVIGWPLVLGGLGFSVGGHLSYGRLFDTILASQDPFLISICLFKLFLVGAVWGGLGCTLLGWGLSEEGLHPADWKMLTGIGLAWIIPLGVFNQETYDLLLFGLGLAALHLYNFFWKRSRILSVFGRAGVIGFGCGFLLSAISIYAARHAGLQQFSSWLALRDQILGMAGGLTLAHAVFQIGRTGLWSPGPLELRGDPRRMRSSSFEKRSALIFCTVIVPALNTLNVLRYWAFEHPVLPPPALTALGLASVILFALPAQFFLRCPEESISGIKLDRIFLLSALFFVWVTVTLAILKQILPFGMARWELSFTLLILSAVVLSLFILLKKTRP